MAGEVDDEEVGKCSSLSLCRMESIKNTLNAGEVALKRIRRGVYGLTLAGAALCFVFSWVLFFVEEDSASLLFLGRPYVLTLIEGLLDASTYVLMALAPLPDDLRITRVVLIGFVLLALVATTANAVQLAHVVQQLRTDPAEGAAVDPKFDGWGDLLESAGLVVVQVLFATFMLVAMRRTEPGQMQQVMWQGITARLLMCMAVFIEQGVADGYLHGDCHRLLLCVGYSLALCVSLRPGLQRRAHCCLRQLFSGRRAEAAAASVAGLLGGCPPKRCLELARSRFRCVELAKLDSADLASNASDPALFGRSAATALGGCDAFVSHSWHDDAELKWRELQKWRAAFIEQHGREPVVWIDKVCIDQTSIEEDLRCLPVFLSGCRELVVFCGATYLQRLWCIVELFTFVHMSLATDRITFIPLCHEGDGAKEDVRRISSGLSRFDARRCECFDPADKARMWKIIDAAYGDMDSFNDAVQQVLRDADLHTRRRFSSWSDDAASSGSSGSSESSGSSSGFISSSARD